MSSLEADYQATYTIHHPAGDIVLYPDEWEGGTLTTARAKKRNARTRKSTARPSSLRDREPLSVGVECDTDVWALKDRINEAAGRDRYTAIRHKIGPRGEVLTDTSERVVGVVGDPTWPPFNLDGGDNTGLLEIESECDE